MNVYLHRVSNGTSNMAHTTKLPVYFCCIKSYLVEASYLWDRGTQKPYHTWLRIQFYQASITHKVTFIRGEFYSSNQLVKADLTILLNAPPTMGHAQCWISTQFPSHSGILLHFTIFKDSLEISCCGLKGFPVVWYELGWYTLLGLKQHLSEQLESHNR